MKKRMIVLAGILLLATAAIAGCIASEETPVETTPTPAEPTQIPATQPTQAPDTQPTQIPATQPTQTPATQPTQVPATQPTEAPAQDKMITGMIQVGAMSFNNLFVYTIEGVPGGTHFSVTDSETIREIGPDEPLTFMKGGTATIQILNEAQTVVATGTLTIPAEYGKYPFEIALV
jgi:glucose/arabinose dehydrogenase